MAPIETLAYSCEEQQQWTPTAHEQDFRTHCSLKADGGEECDKQRSATGRCPWRLVWCHERCHKHECEERRTAIGEAASDVGATLVCLKKAGKFATWLTHAPAQPFVLLTDWREVKPCMQAVAQCPANRPALTVVLGELPQHFERASAWAQSLPVGADPVDVINQLGCPKAFMADVANRLQSLLTAHQGTCWDSEKRARVARRPFASKVALPAMTNCPEVVQRQSGMWWASSGKVQSCSFPRHQVLDMSECGGTPTHTSPFGFNAGCSPCSEYAPLLATTPVKVPPGVLHDLAFSLELPIAEVLSPVCTSHSAGQLEHMLREAMPDHYDD